MRERQILNKFPPRRNKKKKEPNEREQKRTKKKAKNAKSKENTKLLKEEVGVRGHHI
jgi:hypothetical protein